MRKPYSFDNIYTSMIALFQMTTMQGWAEIMYMALSVTDIDSVPVNLSNQVWVIFFIVFIIIGSFFLLNLFVGVVISTFNRQKEKIGGNNLLTDSQKEWIDAKLEAMKAKPIKLMRAPENKFRLFFFRM